VAAGTVPTVASGSPRKRPAGESPPTGRYHLDGHRHPCLYRMGIVAQSLFFGPVFLKQNHLGLSALLGHRYPTSWTKHERASLAGSPLAASWRRVAAAPWGPSSLRRSPTLVSRLAIAACALRHPSRGVILVEPRRLHVGVGTQQARNALRTDDQLVRRAFALAPWRNDEDMAGLIGSLLRTLPLRRPSVFGERARQRLVEATGGVTAGIFAVVTRLAVAAIVSGEERIDGAAVEEKRAAMALLGEPV
jgi:hypothetical protein